MTFTLVDLDGFAHQEAVSSQAGSGFTGIYDVGSNQTNITFDTVNKRLAEHIASLKIVEDGVSATNLGRSITSTTAFVDSIYIRMTAAPGTNSFIFITAGPTNPPVLRVNTTGLIQCLVTGGTAQSGPSVIDGAWHRIDFYFDTSGTAYTLHWAVDGVAQTNATRTGQVAAGITSWRYGSSTAADNATVWFQDHVISATIADFVGSTGMGPHVVLPLYPNGEGTETLGTTNKIQDEGGAQVSLYTHIDDWNGGLPNTTDYVTYASTTTGDSASNFAEFTFTDPVQLPTDVIGYLAGFAAGTTADNADFQILTAHGGTLLSHIGNLIDYSGSTSALGYIRQVITRPAGGWTLSNLSAVVGQWGRSTDTNPQPRLSAVMLEYAAFVTSPTKTQSADAIIKATFTKAQSADAIIKATLTVAQSADAIIKKTLTVAHSADAIVSMRSTKSQSADAIVKKTLTVTHGADALVKATLSRSQSADAIIKKSASVLHSSDAIIKIVVPLTHQADAVIKKTLTVVQSADAIIIMRTRRTHGTDAIIKATLTVAQSADAIIRKTATLSHTADAVVMRRGSLSQLADAVLKKTGSVGHLTDAILKKVTGLSHQADAIVKKTLSDQHATDATIRKTTAKTHGTDTVILATLPRHHGADAIIIKRIALSHGADSFIRYGSRPYTDTGSDGTSFSASSGDAGSGATATATDSTQGHAEET